MFKRFRAGSGAVGLTVSVLGLMSFTAPGLADEGPVPVRVEEDWEVVLNEPESNLDAPQLHTVISPWTDMDHYYGQVTWNYREIPDFVSGGMQISAWRGDEILAKRVAREDPLSTAAETLSWTQSMRCTIQGSLVFQIKDGVSATWGQFGGTELTLMGTVGLYNLSGYSTDFSVANSWVSFGSNRVDLVRIKEVRRYDANNNLISRDTSPRVVFELNN